MKRGMYIEALSMRSRLYVQVICDAYMPVLIRESDRLDETPSMWQWDNEMRLRNAWRWNGFGLRVDKRTAADAFLPGELDEIERKRPGSTAALRKPLHFYGVLVPYWFLVLITGARPAWALLARLRRRNVPALCRTCGYDLRASTGRCPECGTAIPATNRGGVESDPPGKLL